MRARRCSRRCSACGRYPPASREPLREDDLPLDGRPKAVSRREQIKMSEAEVASFLSEERTVTCATVGPRGWPHLMPLWYVLRDPIASSPPTSSETDADAAVHGPRVWAWTYAV